MIRAPALHFALRTLLDDSGDLSLVRSSLARCVFFGHRSVPISCQEFSGPRSRFGVKRPQSSSFTSGLDRVGSCCLEAIYCETNLASGAHVILDLICRWNQVSSSPFLSLIESLLNPSKKWDRLQSPLRVSNLLRQTSPTSDLT